MSDINETDQTPEGVGRGEVEPSGTSGTENEAGRDRGEVREPSKARREETKKRVRSPNGGNGATGGGLGADLGDADTSTGRVRRGCVIIGPSGAGKTTLLAGIYRACQMADDDDLDLTFAATDDSTTEILKEALASILADKKGYEGTTKVEQYPFHIGVEENKNSPWILPSFTDLDIELTDGGGGFIFSPDATTAYASQREMMTAKIQHASLLVLCVDSNRPNVSELYREIESLLGATRTHVTEWVKNPPIARLIHRFRTGVRAPEYVARPRTLLNVDRVLVLLTRVDELTGEFANSAHAAEHIDPVALARETLRPELLRSILKSLRSDAQLAVGICSSYGFMPGGEPFADSTGKPVIIPPKETGVDLLKHWTPFGIREAIYFLATGNARGTVKRVVEADLRRTIRNVELRRTPPKG